MSGCISVSAHVAILKLTRTGFAAGSLNAQLVLFCQPHRRPDASVLLLFASGLNEQGGAVAQPSWAAESNDTVLLLSATATSVAFWAAPLLASRDFDATAVPPFEETATVVTLAGPEALESAMDTPPVDAAVALAVARRL